MAGQKSKLIFTPLEWRPQLAVGHPQIDADHQHLIELVNRIQSLFIDSGTIGELTLALEALRDYTQEHFAREEELQRTIGFPRAKEHAIAHRQLAVRLEELTGKILFTHKQSTTAPALPRAQRQELLQLLRDWLLNHVLLEDLAMRAYLSSTPVPPRSAADAEEEKVPPG